MHWQRTAQRWTAWGRRPVLLLLLLLLPPLPLLLLPPSPQIVHDMTVSCALIFILLSIRR
jgi:hypothetical protein